MLVGKSEAELCCIAVFMGEETAMKTRGSLFVGVAILIAAGATWAQQAAAPAASAAPDLSPV